MTSDDRQDTPRPDNGEERHDEPLKNGGLGMTLPQNDDGPVEEPRSTRRTRLVWLIGGSVLALLLVALFAGMFFDDGPEQMFTPVASPVPHPPAPAPEPTHQPVNEIRGQATGDERPYEETLGVPLERMVRQIDYALIETLLFTGYDPHAMTIGEMRLESFHDEQYHYQSLNIELEKGPDRFLEILKKSLAKWAPEADLKPLEGGGYEVSVAGRATHRLAFSLAEPEPPAPELEAALALVIDDLGQDLHFARELAKLPFPVTFSVLPGTPHGREVADVAIRSGHELFLHLPMEPKGWPGINPGPGALFISMTEAELKRTLDADLKEISGATGVNNHMGSKFTSHAPGMAVVLEELKARGLFFLDSLTARESTVASQGRKIGLPTYKRSIFLDNIRDEKAIIRQLEKAERVAAISGQAVAIGHPYPETLAALKNWGERNGGRVRIVPVRDLKPIQ